VRSRVFLKLLAAFLLVIAVTTATLDFSIRRGWEKSLRQKLMVTLTEETRLFAQRVETDKTHAVNEIAAQVAKATGARATVIDDSGKVLADTEAEAEKMENHARRPEFAAALAGNPGSATRLSRTLGIEFLYVAAPVGGGAVRLAYPLSAIQQATAEVRRSIALSSGLAVLAAMALAATLAQSVSRRLHRILGFAERIAGGDLSARMRDASSDEIAQLASALDSTAGKLEDSFAELENSRARLETLLDSIQDAVLAISAEGKVQWANRSLRRLLSQIRTGGAVVETIRDPGLVGALQDCLAAGEVRTARATAVVPGRIFEVTAAPLSEGGAVVVLHDLTEVERVDKTRRDFIANVSHELRTPLTSIQGYTETLLDASAANGNTREFLETIRKNANRMARLTEDLLTLARVESGELKLEFQPVPADELLESARQNFRAVAKARGIELVVEDTLSLIHI